MRISQLAEATGLPIATLKFYLRERVLHPGQIHAKTQADYDESHVDRVALVRALTEIGGLSIAATRNVLEAMSDPSRGRLSVLAAAHASLAPPVRDPRPECPLARALLDRLGWIYDPKDAMVDLLERQLEVGYQARVGVDVDRLTVLAELAHQVAEADLSYVPLEPVEAARNVVLGTAVSDQLLITLRRLAQSDVAVRTLVAPAESGRADPAGAAESDDHPTGQEPIST